MKQYLLNIAKYFLLWFLFFAVGRLFFLLVNFATVSAAPFSQVAATFWHALRLDCSAICYIMALPLLLLSCQLCFNAKWLAHVLKIYTCTLLVLCSIVIFCDIAVYSEWANKLNYKALQYLQNPSEVVRSASVFHTCLVIFGVLFYSAATIFLYLKKIAKRGVTPIRRFYVRAFLLFCLSEALLFVGVRGGISQIPISQSAAYFSKHQILNDAAVNPAWNLLHSTLKFGQSNRENPFVVLDDARAHELVKSLYLADNDSLTSVLKRQNVNVVVIVLESWSADLIASLNGDSALNLTPNFSALEKEGILFTRFYANGHRSQQGISAILSGFPPIPINVITDNLEKYNKLNSVVKDFNANGYNTSFYFGGDLIYGNLQAYLMSNQFDKIEDEDQMPYNLPHGKLSIFDQYTLDYQLQQLDNEAEPFFSMIFTASTHSPYDEPKIVPQLTGDYAELSYLNAAKYTDFSLGEYFAKAKARAWYANTLFILVADHSHNSHRQRDYHSPEYQQIPMLWCGEVIKDEFRGAQIDKLCSQVDLPLSILQQLGLQHADYQWSNDIFQPHTPEFAAFETTNGMDWVSKNGFWAYNGFSDAFEVSAPAENLPDSLKNDEEERVKAFLQVLYGKYLE